MMKRAEYAKEIGSPIIMHDYITGGWSANTQLAQWCGLIVQPNKGRPYLFKISRSIWIPCGGPLQVIT
jgi:hypothetical protein